MSNTVLAIIEMERFPREVARRAAWVAQQYDCDLELVFSDPTLGFLRDSFMISSDSKQISETIRQAQEEELESLVESIANKGLTVSTSIVHERPASDAIIAKCLEIEPVIVIKGTAYHSPAERATFTFTDWQLLRNLDFPLWLVKPHEWSKKPVIVAAVDPMRGDDDESLDQTIVDTAKRLAARCKGRLHLLHTYESLSAIGDYTKLNFNPKRVPIDAIEKKMHSEHRRQLDELAARNDIAPKATHLLRGRTRDILPSFARANKADVVVMAALSRRGIKRRIIGSTAEQVLDHLPCDILIARAE
jgi:universal stress protein E